MLLSSKLFLLFLLEPLKISHKNESANKRETTYVVQELNRHLDVGRLSRNDHQTLSFTSSWRSIWPDARRTWFHDLNLTCTHVPNFVDLASSFSNDASNQVVRDIYLLCLQLLRGVVRWSIRMRGVARDVRRAALGRSTGVAGRAVGRVRRGWHTLLCFDQNCADIIGGDVDGISNTSDTKNALFSSLATISE